MIKKAETDNKKWIPYVMVALFIGLIVAVTVFGFGS